MLFLDCNLKVIHVYELSKMGNKLKLFSTELGAFSIECRALLLETVSGLKIVVAPNRCKPTLAN